MEQIPYKYCGTCSAEAAALIVGKSGAPNPLADRRTEMFPANKLRITESLLLHKSEMPKWKWQLAKTTTYRYNRQYADCLRIVETEKTIEIVRIK